MRWHVKTFEELTTRELYEIYRLRCEVFIVEQNCAFPDVDAKDLEGQHVFLWDDGLHAYARVYVKPDCTKIGRVVTPKDQRGIGLGKELMRRAIVVAQAHGKPVKVSAQSYLESFYLALGFENCSPVYLEDGIPHQDMVYQASEKDINGNESTSNREEKMKEEKRINSIDPVDHENKQIHQAEDYIEHAQVSTETVETKTDVMKDDKKQVSAEIERNEVADALKDKGC